MKRILYIPGGRPNGGVGAFMYNYHSNFNLDKVQIDYLLFTKENEGEFDNKVKKIGANVHILPELKYMNLILLYKKLNYFFKENNKIYDIVHVHSPNIAFLCLPIAKKYGIKNLIVHSHATMYSDKMINAIRNRILCMPLKRVANIYCACSKAAGEFLYGKKAVKEGNIRIVNNAVECEKFKYNEIVRKEIREELGIEDKFVIGHVGRFSEQKNHTFLIDIFSKVKKMKKDSVLILVGEGPLLEIIREKIKKLELNNDVILLGQRNDVERILQGMDMFVLPSLYEGLPVIGVEAQATGLPCFMADTITKEANINDVQYFSLTEKSDVLANKIIDYYNEFSRKDITKEVQLAGFDIFTEAKKLEDFYINIDKR